MKSNFGLGETSRILQSSLYYGSYHTPPCLAALSAITVCFLSSTPIRIWLLNLSSLMVRHHLISILKLLIASLYPLVPLPVMSFSLNSVFSSLLFTLLKSLYMAISSCLKLCFARVNRPKF